MRVKLTEEQLHNLYRGLNLIEQSSTSGSTQSPSSGTTVSSSGTTSNTPNDAETIAPDLSRFLKILTQDPLKTGAEMLTGLASQFADNIPAGTDLMHPLGPAYKITSGFGPRNIGAGTSKNHKGVDIGAAVGTPIYAPTDGNVVKAGDTTPNGCGGYIKLDHPQAGIQTKYCHCSKWVVKDGDQVKKGQLIGYTGGAVGAQYAGNSQGPHLHYEVLNSNGIAFNPTTAHSNMA